MTRPLFALLLLTACAGGDPKPDDPAGDDTGRALAQRGIDGVGQARHRTFSRGARG